MILFDLPAFRNANFRKFEKLNRDIVHSLSKDIHDAPYRQQALERELANGMFFPSLGTALSCLG
ncbi:hypothetical protein AS888_12490 [Peribacillus simplex]|uniref:Uncharacterized protein n=1 Tax=Peribacillus simplex TaxID=1478 RepID=A0A120GR47_9BACI|nr:hypothetical protein AS888_12490 [Peribacillus simplex]